MPRPGLPAQRKAWGPAAAAGGTAAECSDLSPRARDQPAAAAAAAAACRRGELEGAAPAEARRRPARPGRGIAGDRRRRPRGLNETPAWSGGGGGGGLAEGELGDEEAEAALGQVLARVEVRGPQGAARHVRLVPRGGEPDAPAPPGRLPRLSLFLSLSLSLSFSLPLPFSLCHSSL